MNGTMVNDRLIKGGQSIVLKGGDIVVFGQDTQSYTFQYAQPEPPSVASLPLLDDKISLVPKSYPTYARVDHLATPQVTTHSKTAMTNVFISNFKL